MLYCLWLCFEFQNNEKRRITKIHSNLMYPSPCVLLIMPMHSVSCNTTPLYFLIKDIKKCCIRVNRLYVYKMYFSWRLLVDVICCCIWSVTDPSGVCDIYTFLDKVLKYRVDRQLPQTTYRQRVRTRNYEIAFG